MEALANVALRCNTPTLPHNMDEMAESIVIEAPPTLQMSLAGIKRDLYLIRSNAKPSTYVDIFIDDFLGLAQLPAHRQRQVQQTLLHTLDKMFWPCDSRDSSNRKELLSLNKLLEGGCIWSTCQVLLGWVIDMVNITLSLPPRQENRFKEILAGIPCSQKRIGMDKWYRVLGNIFPVDISLPGARGIFSHMQEAILHMNGKQVALTRGVHQALAEFQWLVEYLGRRPTQLYEFVSLQTTLDVYHNASGYMCGGAVLLGSTAVPRLPKSIPALWPHPRSLRERTPLYGSRIFPQTSHPNWYPWLT